MSKELDTWTVDDLLLDCLEQLAASKEIPSPQLRLGPKMAQLILPMARLWQLAERILSLAEDTIVMHEFDHGELCDAAIDNDWDYTQFLSELRRTDAGGVEYWSRFKSDAIRDYRKLLMLVHEAKRTT